MIGMRERIAVAGGRLAVDGHSRNALPRVGEGVHHVAEGEQRPARAGLCHLRLEGIALGLGRDWIGGTVHGEHLGLDVAALGGVRRDQRSVHGHHGLHVGARAREIEDVEAAEAEADGGAPVDVADRAPVRFAGQRVERGRDPAPHARRHPT